MELRTYSLVVAAVVAVGMVSRVGVETFHSLHCVRVLVVVSSLNHALDNTMTDLERSVMINRKRKTRYSLMEEDCSSCMLELK